MRSFAPLAPLASRVVSRVQAVAPKRGDYILLMYIDFDFLWSLAIVCIAQEDMANITMTIMFTSHMKARSYSLEKTTWGNFSCNICGIHSINEIYLISKFGPLLSEFSTHFMWGLLRCAWIVFIYVSLQHTSFVYLCLSNLFLSLSPVCYALFGYWMFWFYNIPIFHPCHEMVLILILGGSSRPILSRISQAVIILGGLVLTGAQVLLDYLTSIYADLNKIMIYTFILDLL